jgi:glycosyltransferase involved in cell wall biosynthesis
MSESDVSVFVPAYNAEAYLEAVIARIPEPFWLRIMSVWIVNDGSTDGTVALARKLARQEPKIRVYSFALNRGYGEAVRKGLMLCGAEGASYAVCMHADGQYPPETIPRFVEEMESRGLDVLQGSRIASGTALSGGMPLYKYVANRILTFFENRMFGLSMSDFHSGYLVYSRRALDTIAFDRLSAGFDFDLEVIAAARALGLAIGELPVPTRYAGEKSYVNPVLYGVRCCAVMAKYRAGRYARMGRRP